MWDAERPGVTIPDKYLTQVDDHAIFSRARVPPPVMCAGEPSCPTRPIVASSSKPRSAPALARPSPRLVRLPPRHRRRRQPPDRRPSPRRRSTASGVGIIGLGNQGSSHLSNFLKVPGAEVRALCDLVPAKVDSGLAACAKAGAPKPATYTGGPEEWRKLCDSDLDLVYIVTPWELHAPMCVEAMRKGKHAATEVPMAPTIDECWQLVETSEQTRRHCVMMENCCYDREEMMILNMVRQGVFGELLHAECGYLHDLRELKLSPTYYEGRWRLAHSDAAQRRPVSHARPRPGVPVARRQPRQPARVAGVGEHQVARAESLGREDVRAGQPGGEAEVRARRRGQHASSARAAARRSS